MNLAKHSIFVCQFDSIDGKGLGCDNAPHYRLIRSIRLDSDIEGIKILLRPLLVSMCSSPELASSTSFCSISSTRTPQLKYGWLIGPHEWDSVGGFCSAPPVHIISTNSTQSIDDISPGWVYPFRTEIISDVHPQTTTASTPITFFILLCCSVLFVLPLALSLGLVIGKWVDVMKWKRCGTEWAIADEQKSCWLSTTVLGQDEGTDFCLSQLRMVESLVARVIYL